MSAAFGNSFSVACWFLFPEHWISVITTLTMVMRPSSILALCSFIAPTFAQSNGMIMSMDGPMDLAVGRMLPYVHFTPGDTGE